MDLGCIHQMCPCSLLGRGSCSSRTGTGSGHPKLLPRPEPSQARLRSSRLWFLCYLPRETWMPLPRPQTPAGHSTLQDLLWGHMLWGGHFLFLVLCLKIKCLSSSEQLGYGASSPGSHQGAAGTSLQALGWRCSAANSNQTSLLQHSHCHGASQTPTKPPSRHWKIFSNLNDTFIL